MTTPRLKIESYRIDNKIVFRWENGSDVLYAMTKDQWIDYIHKLYTTLMMDEDKKGNLYDNAVYFYNCICKEFNIKTI